jgi:hypothetical protein
MTINPATEVVTIRQSENLNFKTVDKFQTHLVFWGVYKADVNQSNLITVHMRFT